MFSCTTRAREFLRLWYIFHVRARIFQKILAALFLRDGINHEWLQALYPLYPWL
jgi:hypothetical protein